MFPARSPCAQLPLSFLCAYNSLCPCLLEVAQTLLKRAPFSDKLYYLKEHFPHPATAVLFGLFLYSTYC